MENINEFTEILSNSGYEFPYTDFNKVNLDWICTVLKEFLETLQGGGFTMPGGGDIGQVLTKLSDADFTVGWGYPDYGQTINKPKINGKELTGNKTAAQLNLVAAQTGMGLSQNSFTDEEKALLNSLYFVDRTFTYSQLETAYTHGKKIMFFENGELFPVMFHPANQFIFFRNILNGGERTVTITSTVNWFFNTKSNPGSAVKYIAQTLSVDQKAQARTNIGAISLADLPIYDGGVS